MRDSRGKGARMWDQDPINSYLKIMWLSQLKVN